MTSDLDRMRKLAYKMVIVNEWSRAHNPSEEIGQRILAAFRFQGELLQTQTEKHSTYVSQLADRAQALLDEGIMTLEGLYHMIRDPDKFLEKDACPTNDD